ncbi:MAG: GGDEF domain-containing protein [Clostridia bacterium]|nr:GGDEF domain-containing protein [Clostridia bacterium]
MTGLFSRAVFDILLIKEMSYSRRSKTDLSLLMLDIDDFKEINDHLGHQEGDFILMALGKILKEKSRSMDIACRYGGDEFIVIMPGSTLEDAQVYAVRIKAALEDIKRLNKSITVSIGLSSMDDDDYTGDMLIKRADENLYHAKIQGKNQVVFS